MQITIKKQELEKAIQAVAVDNDTKEVQPHLLLDFDNGVVRSYNNQFDKSYKLNEESFNGRSDLVLTNAKTLSPLLSKITNEEITLETDSDTLVLKLSDIATFRMLTYDLSGLKQNAFKSNARPLRIDFSELSKAIGAVLNAVDTKRDVLKGVNFKSQLNTLILTATNGAIFSQYIIETDSDIEFNINVPVNACKIMQGLTSEVELTLNENQTLLEVNSGALTFTTTLISGDYPKLNVEGLKTASNFATLKVNTKEILKVLDRLMIYNDKVSLKMQNNEVEIATRNNESGNGSEKLMLASFDKDLLIYFNANYLITALKSFNEEEVEIHFGGVLKPFMIYNEKEIQLMTPVREY